MALSDGCPTDSLLDVSKESSCHMSYVAGFISAATHITSTHSCRGLAGPFIAVRSTSPPYASS